MTDVNKHLSVCAFGGNALLRDGNKGTFKEQLNNCYETCKNLLPMIKAGKKMIITHGNGPQVGVGLLKNDAGKKKFDLPVFPMFVCGAETQGLIGYMIESCLRRVLFEDKIDRKVITIITQVEVDKDDEAFKNPRKPVGPYYKKEEADEIAKKNGWVMKEDAKGRGWRRVVPSPVPIGVNNVKIIEKLAREGNIVVCVGGGGIPVIKENGIQVGRDAVIDKDLATSFLAKEVNADEFIVFTDVSNAYLNFNKKDQKKLLEITVKEAQGYLDKGEFGEGSMKPKIQAAVTFVTKTGKPALITDAATIKAGGKGTTIVK